MMSVWLLSRAFELSSKGQVHPEEGSSETTEEEMEEEELETEVETVTDGPSSDEGE